VVSKQRVGAHERGALGPDMHAHWRHSGFMVEGAGLGHRMHARTRAQLVLHTSSPHTSSPHLYLTASAA